MLTKNIKRLETFGLPLTDSFEIIEEVENNLQKTPGLVGQVVYEKFKNVKLKNTGTRNIQDLFKMLNGEQIELSLIYPFLNFAPLQVVTLSDHFLVTN